MNESEALSWALDELVNLIRIPSYSNKEDAIVAYLAERVTRMGFPVHTSAVEGAGPNMLVGWDPKPKLLLTAHTDTIAPTWDWEGRERVDGTVVHGLGAQDDKGCVVACLLGLKLALDEGVELSSMSAGVGLCVDEEVGGKGSRAMAMELQPKFVVGVEGTELRTAIVEAGYVEGWVTVYGKSAHHSFMEEGDNAIENAARIIVACSEAPFTRLQHPLGAANRVSVHALSSSPVINVVPDSARFFLNARIFGPCSPAEVVAELTQICDHHNGSFKPDEVSRWFETPSDAPLVQAMAAATRSVLSAEAAPTYMPARTDAHNFVEVAGSQAVVFGPGHLRSAHGPQEHVDVREVVKAARIFAKLLADADTHLSQQESNSY